MTTNIAFSTSDGYIRSSSTVYATAQAGAALTVFSTDAVAKMGQNKVGATYEIYEAFFAFPYTLDTTSIVVSAYFDFFQSAVFGTSVARTWEMRKYDWNDPLGTDNWRTPAQLDALTTIMGVTRSVQNANQKHIYSSRDELNEELQTTGTKQVIASSSRFILDSVPTGAEYNEASTVEAGGTSNDPTMVWTTVPINSLVRVGTCHVQLSDGRHVFLEANTGGSGPTAAVKLHDGTSASTIVTNLYLSGLYEFGSSNQGMQSVALARDNADNLYIISHRTNAGNWLNVLALKKTGGSTWAAQAVQFASMPANPGVINNLAAAWHNVGSSGTVVVVGSHESFDVGSAGTGQMFYALLNCAGLLTNSGPLLRGSGDAYPSLISTETQPDEFSNFLNETGSCLDITALPSGASGDNRGVVVSSSRSSELGDYAAVSIVRYILSSGGTSFSQTNGGIDNPIKLWATKDAGTKVRVLPISESQWAIVAIDRDGGWGAVIRVAQNIGTSTVFSELGSVQLDAEGISSMPAPSALDTVYAWDAIYHPDANRIWFFYFDTADNRRLMRTGFDLNTYKADKSQIQVATAVGAVGSTNPAIRVQHGRLTESEVIISIANKTSGGAQSTIYVVDKLNVPPSAPTLVEAPNYDATSTKLFDWTFNDLNIGDTQTAYEFQVDNADTSASVVATGKVLSTVTERSVTGGTLTNGVNYRWRVRTWDTSDVIGAWSNYDFFTTSVGGSVNITAPATDNPAGVITDDYTVMWTVTGTTQASYKVRVIRTSNSTVHFDSGWVSSTATSHLITGLLSDVEYRIEVTVRNAALVETNTAARLITANFNEPEIPLLTVTAFVELGHILIDITNPVPQGDKPEVTVNQVQRRALGDSLWTTVAAVAVQGEYQDYNVGSGTTYEYKVVGVAAIGSVDSAVHTVTLVLEGVWIHLPQDPAGTSLNLKFGKNQRNVQHQTASVLTHFAGREYPVADFARYHDHVFSVTVDVPFGTDWATTIDALYAREKSHTTVVYRDNRRRFSFGIITNLNEADVAWGSQFSFDFSRVDYNEAVA